MYKLKRFLSKSATPKIYYEIIYHYLIYNLPDWGSTFPTYMSKLSTLQNKVVKLICDGKNQAT